MSLSLTHCVCVRERKVVQSVCVSLCLSRIVCVCEKNQGDSEGERVKR